MPVAISSPVSRATRSSSLRGVIAHLAIAAAAAGHDGAPAARSARRGRGARRRRARRDRARASSRATCARTARRRQPRLTSALAAAAAAVAPHEPRAFERRVRARDDLVEVFVVAPARRRLHVRERLVLALHALELGLARGREVLGAGVDGSVGVRRRRHLIAPAFVLELALVAAPLLLVDLALDLRLRVIELALRARTIDDDGAADDAGPVRVVLDVDHT